MPEGGLYIVLISVHGLIRGSGLELGRDADTGGQVTYVVELARALAAEPEVGRIDLLTRRIDDAAVSDDYARDREEIAPGASIIRLECGPRRYIRKELLWPYLDGFSDQALKHLRRVGRVPDCVHGHYADAGYVGNQISSLLGVPFIQTGHSLGRVKSMRLQEKGIKAETIESRYKMSTRIEAEERALEHAELVIASTRQEVEEQYALYDHYQPSRMRVIPPGVDLSRFRPPGRPFRAPPIQKALDRFLRDPGKPLILAMSRPDPRKNVSALVRAYGESATLQDRANLALVLGNRDRIASLDREARDVLSEILQLIDDHDLYGRVAYPKHHQPDDVPALYRIAAQRQGVFVNPALTEPFGLTLIEAAASGVPVVATHDGGPRDILSNCENGVLVDPLDDGAIADALLSALSDRRRWKAWARNGVRGAHRHYSWRGHVRSYLKEVNRLVRKYASNRQAVASKSRLPVVESLLVTDIDDTLVGDTEALASLVQRLRDDGGHIGLAIATGRNLAGARKVLKKLQVPVPDVWLTSVGTEIHYGAKLTPDRVWQRNIDYRWNPVAIRDALAEAPGLELQPEEFQHRHKISYFVDADVAAAPRELSRFLRKKGLAAKLIYSHEAYLDVVPIRASKGLALRHVLVRWGLPIDRVLVAGGSGNDEEMLTGNTFAVVLGNHSPELSRLRGRPRIYFAKGDHAWGILEAIDYYNFFGTPRDPAEAQQELETEEELAGS